MIELTRRYELFPPPTSWHSPALSEAEETERIFGKCANPGGHGHNYRFGGHPDGSRGRGDG